MEIKLRDLIFELILRILSFFDYWIKENYNKSNKKNKIICILLKVFFILIISSIVSFLVTLVIVIFFKNLRESSHIIQVYTLILLAFVLTQVEYLNKNIDFNLPEQIMELIFILMNLKYRKKAFGLFELIIYIAVTVGFLTFLINKIFNSYSLDNNIPLYIIILFSLIISFFIFSECTKEPMERSSRQLVSWIFVFIMLVVLSIIQILKSANQKLDLTNFGILTFGIVYNIATLADKMRLFIYIHKRNYYKEIELTRKELHNICSYNKELSEGKKSLEDIKNFYKTGSLKQKVQVIGIVFICITVIVLNIFFIFK